ncbi:MAG TPA: DUF2207 domain-containing protein [Steroidobacteraceae bacterium]|jgi:uncharacterized membrane protein YgcG|nr:DUF2207 domain-containing protein [Steroidobacteraceae bacterium]
MSIRPAAIKVALFALLISACSPAAFADERILSFDETITVAGDGSLSVHDTVRVRAEGEKIRRGIYRDFPTDYRGRDGQQVRVGFAFESARRDGQDEPWHSENRGNGVRVYLGSPDAMVSHGEHVYELNYRTDRQMGFFADHDELYWNVTGTGWDFAIDRVTARVVLPDRIPASGIKLEAYTGAQGAKGHDYTAVFDGDAPMFATTRELGAHEGLTIVAMWPKGFITPPSESALPMSRGPASSPGYDFSSEPGVPYDYGWSPAEKLFGHPLSKNGLPALYALMGFALLLFYYYYMWNKVGRDPPARIVIPEYEAPKGHSPPAMRYLLEMDYDDKCFAAGVLSLAVKGYLRIRQDSGILGLGKSFTLVRESAPGSKPLSADENALLQVLFKDGDTLLLKQENHSRVREVRSIHESAIEQGYSSGFFKINGGWHMLGILLSIVLALPAIFLPGRSEVWPQWHLTTPAGWFTIAVVILMLVTNGIFGKLLKAPTVAGQAVMGHIRGFRMYMEVAEGEELKRMKTPPPPLTPQLFESYLPAALALGVEQRWAERFADVLNVEAPNYSPTWYAGSGWNIGNLGGFTRDMSSSLSSAISSSSQAPGSSSGGGGGGSSGGGGGGGGGGGW